jgi:hypothetical protein
MMKIYSVSALVLLSTALLACGNSSPCSDPNVLTKVKELFDQQEFGQFMPTPPKVFKVQDKTATSISTGQDKGGNRCSVVVTSDIIEMMRFTEQATEEEIVQIKQEAAKRNFPLTKDYLTNYAVQPLASGQHYVNRTTEHEPAPWFCMRMMQVTVCQKSLRLTTILTLSARAFMPFSAAFSRTTQFKRFCKPITATV